MESITDFPKGANYYLSCWYKRSELGIRTATFFAMAAIAGSFGGLLAAAIALMDGIGGRPGWAWIVSNTDDISLPGC
jgi:MFS family permease